MEVGDHCRGHIAGATNSLGVPFDRHLAQGGERRSWFEIGFKIQEG